MKKVTLGSLWVMMAVLACACGGFQNNRLGTLSLRLSLDTIVSPPKNMTGQGRGPGKSLTPAEPWTPSRYAISGSGPGGAEFALESAETSAETKLVPGEWNIVVRAISTGGKGVASGTSRCILQPGRTTATRVILLPLEGTGDLALSIVKNFEIPAGGRISGTLDYRGLPGHPAPSSPSPLPIDIPAEQTSVSFPGIKAGHYMVSLKLSDSDDVIAGGIVETILVMAGFLTEGTCPITMGSPGLEFSLLPLPFSPLPPPFLSVSHIVSQNHSFLPLAISRSAESGGGETPGRWFVNGVEIGSGVRLAGNLGLFPPNTLVFPPDSASDPSLSLLRADYVESSGSSFQTGSAGVTARAGKSLEAGSYGWRGSYDCASAAGPALHESSSPFSAGTGAPYAVKAVAGSPSGLVAAAGLDKEGAIHAFAAGYGAELDLLASPGTSTLPIDASWIRLWRDEIRIGGSAKNADRLAVSKDGGFIAAASSVSSWLRVYALDTDGRIIGSYDQTSSTPNLGDFSNIKALCFSEDGKRLYAAANSPEAVYSFDVGRSGVSFASRLALERVTASSLMLQDLKVTASGMIAVTSREASRVYIVRDQASLSLEAIVEKEADGSGPDNPTSIAVSTEGDAFYVLCDGETVLCLARDNPSSSYTQASVFPIPAIAKNSSFLNAGKNPDGTPDILLVSGGPALVFIEMGLDRLPVELNSLSPPVGDETGIASANGACFVRGAFVLAGGPAAVLSVFGS